MLMLEFSKGKDGDETNQRLLLLWLLWFSFCAFLL